MLAIEFCRVTSSTNFFKQHSRTYELKRCNVTSLKRAIHESTSGFLNRIQLIKLKFKAIRAGMWFQALNRIDRALVDLTIKVAKNIRSVSLAISIFAVVSKLERLLESPVLKSLSIVGRLLAKKNSLIAQKWGNTSAEGWATDLSFAFFLAATH